MVIYFYIISNIPFCTVCRWPQSVSLIQSVRIMTSYNFWVFSNKLLGVLVLLTEVANASFEKEDYSAIQYGLTQTNSDSNSYFSYNFPSPMDLGINFAKDTEDSDIIHLQVQCSTEAFRGEVHRIDRIQAHFSSWILINEQYFP